MRATKIKIGDEVLYKVGQRRGKPTSAFVVEKDRDEITVLRPYRRELVKIHPDDIVSLASEAEYVRPARRTPREAPKGTGRGRRSG